MKTYTLKVKWQQTVELIYVDPNEPLQPGDVIETYEHWDGYAEVIAYVVEVVSVKIVGSEYTLELTYSAAKNPKIAAINCAWGSSKLTLDLETSRATAQWINNPPDDRYDGKADVDVIENQLTEDLGFVAAQRRKRRQIQFRRGIEEVASCCEITGERTGSALEAAHIVEVKDAGGYSASNGILLRADLHRLFDSGALTINIDGTIVLGQQVPQDSGYRSEVSSWKIGGSTLRRISGALAVRNRRDA
jgi:hypothetical protein